MSGSDRRAEFTDYARARRPQLRRMAYALCGDWHTADDIVQNALAKLYVAWPRVRRAAAEDAYVRQTILRSTIDESRRPWRRESAGLEGFDRPAAARPRPGRPARPGRRARCSSRSCSAGPWCSATGWASRSRRPRTTSRISEGTVKSHTSRALERLHHLMSESTEGSAR